MGSGHIFFRLLLEGHGGSHQIPCQTQARHSAALYASTRMNVQLLIIECSNTCMRHKVHGTWPGNHQLGTL